MHLKMSSVKWQPFCPGGDELIILPSIFQGCGCVVCGLCLLIGTIHYLVECHITISWIITLFLEHINEVCSSSTRRSCVSMKLDLSFLTKLIIVSLIVDYFHNSHPLKPWWTCYQLVSHQECMGGQLYNSSLHKSLEWYLVSYQIACCIQLDTNLLSFSSFDILWYINSDANFGLQVHLVSDHLSVTHSGGSPWRSVHSLAALWR